MDPTKPNSPITPPDGIQLPDVSTRHLQTELEDALHTIKGISTTVLNQIRFARVEHITPHYPALYELCTQAKKITELLKMLTLKQDNS